MIIINYNIKFRLAELAKPKIVTPKIISKPFRRSQSFSSNFLMENRSSWKDDQNRLEILILYLNRSLNIFVFRKLRVSSNNPVFINQPHKKLTRSKSAVLQNYVPPTNSKPKREKIPEHMKYSINIVAKSCAQKAKDILVTQKTLNSHAVGVAVAQPLCFEIDFARNPFSASAAWFFVIILKFIFTAIFEIKFYVKKFLGTKKFHFWSPIFINHA